MPEQFRPMREDAESVLCFLIASVDSVAHSIVINSNVKPSKQYI